MKLSGIFKILLAVAVSVLVFYLVLRDFNINKFLLALKTADPSFAIPILLTVLISMYLKALRWMYILRGIKATGTYILFKATILGWFANILLPLNIGEFLRIYFVGKKEKISISSTVGSVAVEKALDGLSFIALMAFVFIFLELPAPVREIEAPLRTVVLTASFVLFLFILLLLLLKGYALKAGFFVSAILKPVPQKYKEKILETLSLFAKGVEIGQSKADVVAAALISVLMRIVLAGITYLVALAFGIKLSFMVFFFIEVFVGLIYSLATTLGVIGSFEIAVVLGLGFFGVEKEVALSIALVQGAMSFLLIVSMGAFFMLNEGLQLRDLREFLGRNS